MTENDSACIPSTTYVICEDKEVEDIFPSLFFCTDRLLA